MDALFIELFALMLLSLAAIHMVRLYEEHLRITKRVIEGQLAYLTLLGYLLLLWVVHLGYRIICFIGAQVP